LTLTGTVNPSTASNQTISWSIDNAGGTGASLNGNILTVTTAGTLTVKATIVNGLNTGDFEDTFTIIVTNFVPVTSITGGPTKVYIGIPFALTGTVNPSNASNKDIVWSVVTIGGTGAVITGGNSLSVTAAGTLTVKATIIDGKHNGTNYENYEQEFTITADGFVEVTSITGVPTRAFIGIPLTLTGTVNPSTASNQTISWSIVNAGTTGASLTGGNTLNVTAAGSVFVKATIVDGLSTGNFEDTFEITVTYFVPVTSITGVPGTAAVGVPLTLTGTVNPSNASNKDIVWDVVDAGTAGGDVIGNTFTATATGSATVRATIIDGLAVGTDYTEDFPITVNSGTKLKVSFRDRAVAPNTANIEKLEIVWAIGATIVLEEFVSTDLNGEAQISIPNPNSGLTIWVKGEKTLGKSMYVGTVAAGGTVNVGELIVGDANRDNKVDTADFNIFSDHFGAYLGHPNYNYLADLSNDGNINMIDFYFIADSFGAIGALRPGSAPTPMMMSMSLESEYQGLDELSDNLSAEVSDVLSTGEVYEEQKADSSGGCNAMPNGSIILSALAMLTLPIFRKR
jgi:hypothetical protein